MWFGWKRGGDTYFIPPTRDSPRTTRTAPVWSLCTSLSFYHYLETHRQHHWQRKGWWNEAIAAVVVRQRQGCGAGMGPGGWQVITLTGRPAAADGRQLREARGTAGRRRRPQPPPPLANIQQLGNCGGYMTQTCNHRRVQQGYQQNGSWDMPPG